MLKLVKVFAANVFKDMTMAGRPPSSSIGPWRIPWENGSAKFVWDPPRCRFQPLCRQISDFLLQSQAVHENGLLLNKEDEYADRKSIKGHTRYEWILNTNPETVYWHMAGLGLNDISVMARKAKKRKVKLAPNSQIQGLNLPHNFKANSEWLKVQTI